MIIKKFIDFIYRRLNPISYWKSKGLVIGENCEIYPTAILGSEPYLITLGNHVRVNAGVTFITHDGGVWVFRDDDSIEKSAEIDCFGEIYVGDNVHIGNNATIMPGVKIGSNVVIGCGAIVTHDVEDNSVMVGIPARKIETVQEYYNKNKHRFEYTKNLNSVEKKEYLIKKYNR
jgi:acetyltransferase-like isoleucine patch superfamily enzyme